MCTKGGGGEGGGGQGPRLLSFEVPTNPVVPIEGSGRKLCDGSKQYGMGCKDPETGNTQEEARMSQEWTRSARSVKNERSCKDM